MEKNSKYFNIISEAAEKKILIRRENGQLAFGGIALVLRDHFDMRFRELGRKQHADEYSFPTMIRKDILEKLGFLSSFPHLATFVASLTKNKQSRYALTPAVCYHLYDFFKGGVLSEDPLYVMTEGHCFRFEGIELKDTPERLWDFTMREIVFFGSPDMVCRARDIVMKEVLEIARHIKLDIFVEEATDPFFLGSSRGKLLIQKLKKLKYELRANINIKKTIAIASFNNHEDFFTKKMNIRLADGTLAHSGCVAFGLERWMYAFLCQHGLDSSTWPKELKNL